MLSIERKWQKLKKKFNNASLSHSYQCNLKKSKQASNSDDGYPLVVFYPPGLLKVKFKVLLVDHFKYQHDSSTKIWKVMYQSMEIESAAIVRASKHKIEPFTPESCNFSLISP